MGINENIKIGQATNLALKHIVDFGVGSLKTDKDFDELVKEMARRYYKILTELQSEVNV